MKRMLMGIAVGAGAMYLLDPEKGSERRGKLLGFYGENKDTFQDYAQTAAQTAVTVGQTVGSTASAVAEKASEITGKDDATTSTNGKGNGATAVDDLLEKRTVRKSSAVTTSELSTGGTTTITPPADPAPGMGGSLSS
ncbi:MAG: YtxH domain-containing protein [Candidatus Dormibacteria bacterium]